MLLSAQGCMSVSISVNAKRNCNCISPQCAHTVYTDTHATNTHSAREDMALHISIKDSAFFSRRAQYSYLGKAFAMLTIHKTDKHTHTCLHTHPSLQSHCRYAYCKVCQHITIMPKNQLIIISGKVAQKMFYLFLGHIPGNIIKDKKK